MKLSRNKISKLIKKKKHSRSKIHKKRDGHTVVFSKSKDYDKPITRKKGGWKGYHAPRNPQCQRRSMKRIYRGGESPGGTQPSAATPVVIQASASAATPVVAENVTPIEEPINTGNKAVPLDNDSARQS